MNNGISEAGCNMKRFLSGSLCLLALAVLVNCDDFSHNSIVNTPPVNYVNLIMMKTYGGDGYDWGSSLTMTADGEFVITGSTTSNGYGDNTVYVAKIDPAGTQIWYKWVGGWGEENGEQVVFSPDSTLVVIGGTTSFDLITGHKIDPNQGIPIDDQNFYLIKLNPDGIVLWEKPYGDTLFAEMGTGLVALEDGYLLAGYQSRAGTLDNFFYVRTDLDGDTIWQRSFITTTLDRPESVTITSDGGFVTAGWTGNSNQSKVDPFFVKIDDQGKLVWEKSHGDTLMNEKVFSVVKAGNGDFIAAGVAQPSSSDDPVDGVLYVIRIDSDGALVWEHTYEQSGINEGRAVLEDQNGFVFVCGQDAARNAIQITKLAGNGDFIWSDSTGALGYGMAMIPAGGGYAITGSNQYPNQRVLNDVLFLRIEEDRTNVEL
jgi:hypothetical protein